MTVIAAQPEVFTILPAADGAGKPVFSVLVKRTYDIQPGKKVVRAEQTNPFIAEDIYYDSADPQFATVQYESDLTPFKPATDVVVIANAYAPGGKPLAQMEASVEVGSRRKIIRLTGDRRCIYRASGDPEFTAPLPFTQMQVRYERAYGGADGVSIKDLPFVYPRNHLGCGVALKNVKEVIDGLALPNIEDPADLLTPARVVLGEPERWNAQPLPAGFGFFAKTWYPRCSYVGSVPAFIGVEDIPREALIGLVSKDQIALARQMKLPTYDPRFGNGASLGLAISGMNGSETIRLGNLNRDPVMAFALPGESPSIRLDIGMGMKELPPALQTVCVRVEQKQVDLTWRGMHEYPGVEWLGEMKKMQAEIE